MHNVGEPYRIGQLVFLPDGTPVIIETIDTEEETVSVRKLQFYCPWCGEWFTFLGPDYIPLWELN